MVALLQYTCMSSLYKLQYLIMVLKSAICCLLIIMTIKTCLQNLNDIYMYDCLAQKSSKAYISGERMDAPHMRQQTL